MHPEINIQQKEIIRNYLVSDREKVEMGYAISKNIILSIIRYRERMLNQKAKGFSSLRRKNKTANNFS